MKKRILPLIIVILTAIMLLSGCKGDGTAASGIRSDMKKQDAYFKGDYVEAENTSAATEFFTDYDFDTASNFRCDMLVSIDNEGEKEADYYQRSKYLYDVTDKDDPLVYLYMITPVSTTDSAGKTVNCNYVAEAYLDSKNYMMYIETKVSDKQLHLEYTAENNKYYGKMKTSMANLSSAMSTYGFNSETGMGYSDGTDMSDYVSLVDNAISEYGAKVYLCGENMLKVEGTTNGSYVAFYFCINEDGFRVKMETRAEDQFVIKAYLNYYHTDDTVTLPDDLYDYRNVNYL